MRVFSREFIVGFLFVSAVVLTACQPVQPTYESVGVSTDVRGEVEDTVNVTDTATLTESAELLESEPISDSASLTDNLALTETAPLTVTGSVTGGGGAASDTADSVDAAVDPALLEAGLAAYRAQYCGVCHTLDIAETRGTFGPDHSDMGAVAAGYFASGTYAGGATSPAEYILESIVDAQAFIVPGYATTSHRMPSYSHLDSETLDALVAFLLAQ